MVRLFFKISAFAVLLSGMLSSCNREEGTGNFIVEARDQKIRLEDNDAFAKKDFDDSAWEEYTDVNDKGIFWVRSQTVFPKEEKPRKNQAILIGAASSYEAYWDGHFIGQNGQLKTAEQPEITGTYHSFFLLPDSLLSAGKHVLSLRATKTDTEVDQHVYFIVGDFFDLTRTPLQVSKYMFMIAGAFLLTAFYFFFLFTGQRKEYALLIFSGICLIFFTLLLFEYLKLFYLYSYPFQYNRLVIIGYCHLALTVLVPLFFMFQFDFPWKIFGIIGLIGGILYIGLPISGSFDELAISHNKFMWLYAVAIVAFAVYQRKKEAIIVLIALLSGLVIGQYMPRLYVPFVSAFDISLFVNFMLIVLSMLYVLTVKRQEERRAYEASLVVSERLKNELLKKNIKPHFIMNTLTSLIDWVEESPKEGVDFIHALAKEFEVLNQIADYKLIPISQEIELCKSHLKVMGFRKEIDYQWEDSGIDQNDIIPPAIIHTAVENGVTHGIPGKNGQIKFHLHFKREKIYKEYTLKTFSENRFEKTINKPEGTGLKYIRARLQESHPGKWKLTSEATNDGWETRIKIFLK